MLVGGLLKGEMSGTRCASRVIHIKPTNQQYSRATIDEMNGSQKITYIFFDALHSYYMADDKIHYYYKGMKYMTVKTMLSVDELQMDKCLYLIQAKFIIKDYNIQHYVLHPWNMCVKYAKLLAYMRAFLDIILQFPFLHLRF